MIKKRKQGGYAVQQGNSHGFEVRVCLYLSFIYRAAEKNIRTKNHNRLCAAMQVRECIGDTRRNTS